MVELVWFRLTVVASLVRVAPMGSIGGVDRGFDGGFDGGSDGFDGGFDGFDGGVDGMVEAEDIRAQKW